MLVTSGEGGSHDESVFAIVIGDIDNIPEKGVIELSHARFGNSHPENVASEI